MDIYATVNSDMAKNSITPDVLETIVFEEHIKLFIYIINVYILIYFVYIIYIVIIYNSYNS